MPIRADSWSSAAGYNPSTQPQFRAFQCLPWFKKTKHQAPNPSNITIMSRAKKIYNITKAAETKDSFIAELHSLSRKTSDPRVRDYCSFMIRDIKAASQIHLQRLKFKIKKCQITSTSTKS